MSDRPQDETDRPLVDDLREQTDDLTRDSGAASVAGGLQGSEPSGDSYEERDEQEGGAA